jgi:DNA helicase-2/ATP-dependent DNA helicase PcrA
MNKPSLSKEQEVVVLHNNGEGSVLVVASAGSGKTRILTERVRYLLTEKKDKFFSVLCLTFTNKAATEMKDRLLGIPKLDDRAFIGNFHEFCLNIIRSRYSDLGLSNPPHIFDENDTKEILLDVLTKNPILKEIYDIPNVNDDEEKRRKQREKLFQCTEFISTQKRNLIEDIPEFETNYKNWGEKTTLLFQDYNRRLREQNAIDYDDILLLAYRILSRNSVASIYRRTYQYIVIDESQDLNYAQYNIIKTICGEEHKNILMVGDPKQAIYGFNGSSPKFMLEEFPADFSAIKMEIKKNYRSSKAVLSLAENIQPNGGVGNPFFDGIVDIYGFDNEIEEAGFIVAEIKKWLTKGKYQEVNKEVIETISLENIAVLARNKFVFSTLISLLDKDVQLMNKYYLKKGNEKFEPESELIKVFDLGIRVIVNPNDELHFRQISDILKVEESVKTNKIDFLLNLSKEKCQIEIDYQLLIVYWKHLLANPKSLGWVIEQLKQKINTQENDTNQHNDIERVMFDLFEYEKHWNNFVRKVSADKQTLSNFRYFLALNNTKESKNELTLATVHTTKGLEFEIVFLMGMNDGVFPDYRAKTGSALIEEKNNLYVAITRAKRCLYLTYPLRKNMPWGEKQQAISRFLMNIKLNNQ